MIARTNIQQTLAHLDTRYNGASSSREAVLMSKLAVLELCGWIEESIDEIALRYGRRLLRKPVSRVYLEKKIVKPVYGFEYELHFKKVIIGLLGVVLFEQVESKVDQAKRAKLEATLSNLKQQRDRQAHTHLQGTPAINAPSATIADFKVVYEGLKEFETIIRSLKRRRIQSAE